MEDKLEITKLNSKPKISYLICFTPRSGSSLLCELFCYNTDLAGQPKEYFKIFSQALREGQGIKEIKRIINSYQTINGVFGAKICWSQYQDFIKLAKSFPTFKNLSNQEIINSFLPQPFYIYLTRKDRIRQAISLWKSSQTDIWGWFAPEIVNYPKELKYSFIGILKCLREINQDNRAWENFFKSHKITPLRLEYETFITDLRKTIKDILDFIGVEQPKNLTRLKFYNQKMADEISEEWYQRFLKDSNSFFKLKLFLANLFLDIDHLIGLIGSFLKKRSPKIYFLLKRIK